MAPSSKRRRGAGGARFYAVRVGRRPGVYETWAEAELQVVRFPGAMHASFTTRLEAENYVGAAPMNGLSALAVPIPLLKPQPQPQPQPKLAPSHAPSPRPHSPAHPHGPNAHTNSAAAAAPAGAPDSGPAPGPGPGPGLPASTSAATASTSTSPATPSPPPTLSLSQEQHDILAHILAGHSYFFTGAAGTGKSVLLRAIVAAFAERRAGAARRAREDVDAFLSLSLSGRVPGLNSGSGAGEGGGVSALEWGIGAGGAGGARHALGRGPGHVQVQVREEEEGRWNLAVTASTGMAAVNIGGCTLHSWAGIGLGKAPAQKLAENIARSKITQSRWRDVGAIIIDEVSMLDARLLDTLEEVARIVRRSTKPFGGIQLILSGDFYQLPPVPDRVDTSSTTTSTATTTATPSTTPPGPRFAFEATCWPLLFPPPRTRALTRVYRQRSTPFIALLERLRHGRVSPADAALLAGCDRPVGYSDGIAPVSLFPSKSEAARLNANKLDELPGAIQEFVSWDEGGVNSRGFSVGKEEAGRILDRNTIWERELKVKVGALVMLVTNLQDGSLVNGSTGVIVDFLTPPLAAKQGVYLPERAARDTPDPKTAWPVVEFVPPQGSGSSSGKQGSVRSRTRTRTLVPQMTVTVNNAQGGVEASRMQVPLVLCWGMTIHKAQGQSIERLRVDLGRVFERGQTYVALSRATSLDTLEVKNFSADRVMAHPRVVEWSRPMEDAQRDEEWDALMGEAAMQAV